MKQFIIGVKLLIIIAIFSTAFMLAGVSDFFDWISLLFVLGITFFLTISGFGISGIAVSCKVLFSVDPEPDTVGRAKEFWLSLIRNFLAAGILGTLIGFILLLANMDDPKRVDQYISISYLTVLYGFIFVVIFPLPAYFRVSDHRNENPPGSVSDAKASSGTGFTFPGSIGLIGQLGLLAVLFLGAGFPETDLTIFFNLPSLLVILGGGLAFFLFVSGGRRDQGGYLTMGLALSGLIGAIAGILQFFKYSSQLSKIGPPAALAMLSMLYALIGMVLIAFPFSDRFRSRLQGGGQSTVVRFFEIGFPLLALIFSTIILLMILSKF